MKLLEVEKICAFYGDIQVLWDVYFEVGEGEIVALIGSNGAGKTTSLRAVSRIARVRSGAIRWMGREIQNDPPHHISRLGIAHVPEGRELFVELSVLDNLLLGAMYTQKNPRRKQELLEQVYGLFPRLRERESQVAGSLSGGEQQMLAIARSLMSDPKLLMLDEPSLGLAPIVVSEMFSAIQEINRRGVTVLLVEQNVHKTLEICARAYVLESGTITRVGSGDALLADDHVRKAYLGL
jgi:branched-chain amino acid transport system ATP-binding protein